MRKQGSFFRRTVAFSILLCGGSFLWIFLLIFASARNVWAPLNSFFPESPCIEVAKKCSLAPASARSVCSWNHEIGRAQDVTSQPLPKIIHQSWKESNLPDDFGRWSQIWKDRHPDWEYRLWTDNDNRDLVQRFFPSFLPLYDSLPANIMRADISRYFYMLRYGGVYSDLDTWPLKDVGNITEGNGVTLAKISYEEHFQHNIPNAWMASQPGHPFWKLLILLIDANVTEAITTSGSTSEADKEEVEKLTGPVILKKAVDTWKCMHPFDTSITVLDPGYVYLCDWHEENPNSTYYWENVAKFCNPRSPEGKATVECLQFYPNAHVVTAWTHSWG